MHKKPVPIKYLSKKKVNYEYFLFFLVCLMSSYMDVLHREFDL